MSAWNRAVFLGFAILGACDPYPRVNPLDPQCDMSQANCSPPVGAEPDASPTGGGHAAIIAGTVDVNMRDTKCVDLNNDGKLQPGETARILLSAKNTGTQGASIVASLENLPASAVVTDCVENPGGFGAGGGTSTACAGACNCDSTLTIAKQLVSPGQETADPVLFFYVKVVAGTASGTIELPVKFTSAAGETWRDNLGLVVSP